MKDVISTLQAAAAGARAREAHIAEHGGVVAAHFPYQRSSEAALERAGNLAALEAVNALRAFLGLHPAKYWRRGLAGVNQARWPAGMSRSDLIEATIASLR